MRLVKSGFSCWELIFAIFRKSLSIWNYKGPVKGPIVYSVLGGRGGGEHFLNKLYFRGVNIYLLRNVRGFKILRHSNGNLKSAKP